MVDSLSMEKFKEIAKSLVIDIITSVENSHEKAFGENREIDDLISGIILNNAVSANNSLKILYYQNPDFEHNEFDKFFASFDTYKCELLRNIRTDHSHQWTDIEFRSFIKNAIPLTELLDMGISDNLSKHISNNI